MPELPEVQTVVTSLLPHVLRRTITHTQLLRPDILMPPSHNLAKSLKGRRITSLTRRGKRIVFTLDDDHCFYIHLGMTGQLTAEPPTNELKKHTHLILTLDPSTQLRFRDPRRFGGIFWLGCDSLDDERMGPEPLTITPKQLATQLAGSKRPIKNALMDQSVIAGLGNIYVDESLHASRLHPLTHAGSLAPAQIKTLTQQIKRILNGAIKARGSSLRDYVDAVGTRGAAQALHRVYGRTNKPCLTCGTPIQRITLGGRSTHFCPTCQPRSVGRG